MVAAPPKGPKKPVVKEETKRRPDPVVPAVDDDEDLVADAAINRAGGATEAELAQLRLELGRLNRRAADLERAIGDRSSRTQGPTDGPANEGYEDVSYSEAGDFNAPDPQGKGGAKQGGGVKKTTTVRRR
jgi:hypothetical protein